MSLLRFFGSVLKISFAFVVVCFLMPKPFSDEGNIVAAATIIDIKISMLKPSHCLNSDELEH
jgi:hypothetical protein